MKRVVDLTKILLVALLVISTPVKAEDEKIKSDKTVDVLSIQAWSMYRDNGKPSEVRQLVDQGLAQYPGHLSLTILSAMLHADQGQCDVALKEIGHITEVFDSEFDMYAAKHLDPVAVLGEDDYHTAKLLYAYVSTVQGLCNHQLEKWEESKKYLLKLEHDLQWPLTDMELAYLADDYFYAKDYAAARHYYIVVYKSVLLKFSSAKDDSFKSAMRNAYEGARYNLVIVNYLMGDQAEATKWFKLLLTETPRRDHWLAEMRKDKDYDPILARKEYQAIIEKTVNQQPMPTP